MFDDQDDAKEFRRGRSHNENHRKDLIKVFLNGSTLTSLKDSQKNDSTQLQDIMNYSQKTIHMLETIHKNKWPTEMHKNDIPLGLLQKGVIPNSCGRFERLPPPG